MQTNLKEALKSADTVKSPLGDIQCYSMNFAQLAGEINVHLENNKIKFTWREYIQLAQIIWDKIKETRMCRERDRNKSTSQIFFDFRSFFTYRISFVKK